MTLAGKFVMDTTEEVEFDYEAHTRDNPPDLSKFRPAAEVRRERREAFKARLINHINMEIKHAREMRQVFISYCHENRTIVDRLCEYLASHDIHIWLDRDNIEPGSPRKQAIQQAIQHGDFFIACFSTQVNVRNHTYMSEELKVAIEELHRRPVDKVWFIPVKLNACEIPDIDIGGGETLRDLQYVDLHENWETGIRCLLNTISLTAGHNQKHSANASTDEDNECVLFRSIDGQCYFIPFQKVCWNSKEISLTLCPNTSAQSAFLSRLRTRLRNVPDGSSIDQLEAIAFAHQENAAWVKLRAVAQISTGGETVWEILLKEDTVTSAYKHRTEPIIFEQMTLNQVANLRAKRLLLDEKLAAARSFLTQTTVFDQMLLETQIRGELSSQYGNRLQVLASPIPELYHHFRKTPERFKKFARLISVLYLKLSNTIEDILQLDVELHDPAALQVKFRGRCHQLDINEEPAFVEFEGNCPLSE